MKSTVKTALTLSMLLPLAGCFDFGWSKKENKVENAEVAHHGAAQEKSSKCSHKGCTHDHSKDGHKKSHHHEDEVKTQDMNEDMDEEMDMNNGEVEVQDLEEDADENDDEDFN
jgi:hypothetical protein